MSLGRKVTLLNAVINNIPIYILYFFKTPRNVVDEISKIHRTFTWCNGDGKRKICWVSWDKVSMFKEDWSLGVKSVKKFNFALISNWG